MDVKCCVATQKKEEEEGCQATVLDDTRDLFTHVRKVVILQCLFKRNKRLQKKNLGKILTVNIFSSIKNVMFLLLLEFCFCCGMCVHTYRGVDDLSIMKISHLS